MCNRTRNKKVKNSVAPIMQQIVRELAINMNARNLNIDDAIVNVDLSKNFNLAITARLCFVSMILT
jgi:enolase